MTDAGRRITFRDATLREGLDTPGVSFPLHAHLEIARALAEAGVEEIEIVAPAHVDRDVPVARAIADAGVAIARTGLLYATSERLSQQIAIASAVLDRAEILMPVSPQRAPAALPQKIDTLVAALTRAREAFRGIGAGFPNSTQVAAAEVVDAACAAVDRGADRITLYDTNGSADPERVAALVATVAAAVDVPVFFHGHNDLGLATANAQAAVRAGASGLDVTVNGLGDRAGNTSLEQVAVLLHLRGVATGVVLDHLPALSALVARCARVPIPALAPVVGAHVFAHKSLAHLDAVTVFEAFNPSLVGRERAVSHD